MTFFLKILNRRAASCFSALALRLSISSSAKDGETFDPPPPPPPPAAALAAAAGVRNPVKLLKGRSEREGGVGRGAAKSRRGEEGGEGRREEGGREGDVGGESTTKGRDEDADVTNPS